ncbi:MAG: aminopeptidase P family protein [Crocinitomicaceae bacterium]|nr:aminopeptidase P family protein [Crocinitomicaceae bacterium]
MTAKDKVALLRAAMHQHAIDTFIVYSADPHMSEYLPEEWKERTWLSGFTGSAGFVVITKNNAGLWTDGRYFTQAPIELAGSGIDLFKDGIEGTPNYIDWIISETQEGSKIAVNALCTSNANWELLQNKLAKANRQLIDMPLLKEIWKDRGTPVKNPVFVQPVSRAGKSASDKLTAIRQEMNEMGASFHLLSSLDDIAWTLNLRGSDVECNPVFLSYLTIGKTNATLYVDTQKLTDEARQLMHETGVSVVEYNRFFEDLKTIKNQQILISPNCNQSVFETLKTTNTFIKTAVPGNLMKAQKNETELNGFRSAMVKDGVAMVNFLYWLTHNVGKEPMTEYTIGKKLRGFRAEQRDFVGESFDSIIGYKGNGAIIHYKAPKEGCSEVTNDGSILVDSGGQYLEGTTDITRTFPLGSVSEEFKHDATLVLKGHIQLSMMKFPKGTRGVQLDTLARMALWNEGKDYNHGTGHGVGCFMNVHEGPQNIRKDMNPQELLPGMVVSNEPGYYVEGKYGIRHENLVVVKEWKKTEWNTFYEFETLTFCPFFKNAIVKELLSAEEIQWLNNYHKQCEEKLGSFLNGAVKEWFLELVTPL